MLYREMFIVLGCVCLINIIILILFLFRFKLLVIEEPGGGLVWLGHSFVFGDGSMVSREEI